MQQVLKDFNAAVLVCLKLASDIYNVKLDASNVDITTDVTGRAAGWARPLKHGKYKLRFNREAILKHNDEMTKDTIPHEVAHLVCFARPELGSRHDLGWKAVCRRLGGDDSRTHDMLLTPARTPVSRRVDYILASGRVCSVGPKHHVLIQGGRTDFFMRSPKEYIKASDWVGYGKAPAPRPTTAPQPTPIPGLNVVRSDIPDMSHLISKRQKASALYFSNLHLARADVIRLFVLHAELTQAGAATYYQNFKSGKYV